MATTDSSTAASRDSADADVSSQQSPDSSTPPPPAAVHFAIHCPQLPAADTHVPFHLAIPVSQLASMTVADFKRHLSHAYTPLLPRPEHQRLIYAGREWADGQRLVSDILNVEQQQPEPRFTLHLVVTRAVNAAVKSTPAAAPAATSSSRPVMVVSPTPSVAPTPSIPSPTATTPLLPTSSVSTPAPPTATGGVMIINGLPYLAVPTSAMPPVPPQMAAHLPAGTSNLDVNTMMRHIMARDQQLHHRLHAQHHANNHHNHHHWHQQVAAAAAAQQQHQNIHQQPPHPQQQQQMPPLPPGAVMGRVWVINLRWLTPMVSLMWTMAKVAAFMFLLMPNAGWFKIGVMCGIGLVVHLVEVTGADAAWRAIVSRLRANWTGVAQLSWADRLMANLPWLQSTGRVILVFFGSLVPGLTALMLPADDGVAVAVEDNEAPPAAAAGIVDENINNNNNNNNNQNDTVDNNPNQNIGNNNENENAVEAAAQA